MRRDAGKHSDEFRSPDAGILPESVDIATDADDAKGRMYGSSAALFLVVLFASALLSGCGSTGKTRTSDGGLDLVGTRWLAEDIDGKGVIDMLQSTIQFDSNTSARANGGCNSAFGNVTFDGDKLVFGAFGMTMRMCSEAVSNQETRFFAALGAARRYRLDTYSDLLYFMDADNREILRFSRMAPLDTEPVDD